MLPEFPSAARISEFVCDLEYLFSRMNVGKNVGLWVRSLLVPGRIVGLPPRGSGIHIRTMIWWTCSWSWLWRERTTPIWKNSSRGTPYLGELRGSKAPSDPYKAGGKGGGKLTCHA